MVNFIQPTVTKRKVYLLVIALLFSMLQVHAHRTSIHRVEKLGDEAAQTSSIGAAVSNVSSVAHVNNINTFTHFHFVNAASEMAPTATCLSNLRITQQTCNNGSVLKLAVNGPDGSNYTWKYRDHNNVMHTLTTTGGKEYNVPVSAHPILGSYTFFVQHPTANFCSGSSNTIVVNPRITQATSVTAVRLCDRIQLIAHGDFDLTYPYIFKWVAINNGNGNPMNNIPAVYTTVPYVVLGTVNGNTSYRVEVYVGSESSSTVCGNFAKVNFNPSSGNNTNVEVAARVTNVSNSCTVTASHIFLELNSNMVRIKSWQSKRTNATNWVTLPGATENSIDVLQYGFTTADFPREFRATFEILDENDNVLCEQTTAPTAPVDYTGSESIVRFYTSGALTPSVYTNRQVVFNGNHTLTADITVCSVTVNSGYTLTIPSGRTLTVTNNINVGSNAKIVIEDKGSLIQVADNAINQINGTFQQKIITAPLTRMDYTYWSSPVKDYTLYALSPGTLADKYHSFDPNSAAGWVNHVGGNQIMQTGRGYIVRAPQSFSTTTPAVYYAQFSGTPNNGTVTVPIYRGLESNDGFNLVGNPYPSSISIEDFLLQNQSVIEGYVDLWSHSTPLSDQTSGTHAYNYSPSDYVKYNLTGNTYTELPEGEEYIEEPNPEFPEAEIASGQGFVVTFRPDNVGVQAEILFKNAMRKSNEGTRFFRYANQTESQSGTTPSTVQRDRLWIHLAKNAGQFKQTLVGYVNGATDGRDHLYDAPATDLSSSVNIYSILEDELLTIQGRNWPFHANDRVRLGYKVSASGEYRIGLGLYDGLFQTEQAVYLYDRELDLYHDLKAGEYHFMSAAGQFNTRFEIRYANATLSQDNFTLTQFVAFADDRELYLQAPKAMKAFTVFDITGLTVYKQTVNGETDFNTPALPLAAQILILQVEFEDGSTQIQKIPFK